MASMRRETKRLFLFGLLVAFLPACTGLPGVTVSRTGASDFLRRSRRANFLFEELKRGNLERECVEEKCSYEEAKEIFPQNQLLEVFWRRYTAVDHCRPSPCKNGATCTQHANTYACKCPPGYHGHHCERAVTASRSCRVRNGGCEHFCSENPATVCSCATGYALKSDNHTCRSQVNVSCGRLLFHSQIGPRVVNGFNCPKGSCPWQALLSDHSEFICGAIVLSDWWMLTAAHCVRGRPNGVFHVTVGEHNRDAYEGTEQQQPVDRVVVHPRYNSLTLDSDLALLKLQAPVELGPFVVPVCLAARNTTFSRTLATVRRSTVSGWGREKSFGLPANVLQRLELPRVPLQECRAHTELNITRNMFCAGYKNGGYDACDGDSGGPMVTQYKQTWFLTGVVSWGRGCANRNFYGVYVKVGNYLGWIQETMATG